MYAFVVFVHSLNLTCPVVAKYNRIRHRDFWLLLLRIDVLERENVSLKGKFFATFVVTLNVVHECCSARMQEQEQRFQERMQEQERRMQEQEQRFQERMQEQEQRFQERMQEQERRFQERMQEQMQL